MRIVVTDANIFFDLIGIGALDRFFQLEHEVHTTELVKGECDTTDIEQLQAFVGSGRLHIRTFTVDEVKVVETTGRRKGLRPADRSVLFHALLLKGMVVSGDSDMRKECGEMQLECHGILLCIAELHRHGHYDAAQCIGLLDALEGINKWLPREELEKMRKERGGRHLRDHSRHRVVNTPAATLSFPPRHNSRHAMPSTSKSDLIATILRSVLPQQVPGAEVLPPSTWEEFGLSTSGLKPLPEIVAYSSKGEMLFIFQAVHRTGAPNAARHSALRRWSAAYHGQRVFVWAYASRSGYVANMGELLADTYVWFADEPEHHAYISGSAEMSERYRRRVRA